MVSFAGLPGLLTVVITTAVIWLLCYLRRRKIAAYNLDPRGQRGAFEPLLQKYIRLAEFMIGLATGSIVLLVGSSVLHSKDGHLPSFYASPLLVLAASVLTALSFMACLILSYENVQHGNPHTAGAYSLSEALGFSSLILFCAGYIWLIIGVTR